MWVMCIAAEQAFNFQSESFATIEFGKLYVFIQFQSHSLVCLQRALAALSMTAEPPVDCS